MSIYTISTPLFNAVLSAQADKHETRKFMRGFFIDTKTDRIVATNGWMLCVAPIEYKGGSEKPESVIYTGITRPVMKSDTVNIHLDTDRVKFIGTSRRYQGIHSIAVERVDATYVDYERVIARNEKISQFREHYGRTMEAPKGTISLLALNPEFLYRPVKWAKCESPVKLVFGEDNRSSVEVRFISPELKDLHMTLMPCRA